jgi:hypothetical protein
VRQYGTDESFQRRLRQLLSLNAVGKAARTAFGRATPAANSAGVTQRLRDLHPLEPTETAGTTPRREEENGPSGVGRLDQRASRPHRRKPAASTRVDFVADMLCARCSVTFMERTTSARLTPLQQGEKIRPIAPESAMVKLACLVGQMLIPQGVLREPPTSAAGSRWLRRGDMHGGP